MTIYLVLFIFLVLIGSQCHPEYTEKPLSQSRTLALRGICAFEIMLGHIGIVTDSIFLYANRKAGILIVGVFFLLSGYGLMYSLQTKENYMHGFFKKRVWKLLQPALIIYWVYMIMDVISSTDSISGSTILKYITFYNFPTTLNWYVTEILVLYILFFVLYRILKIKYANLLLLTACTIFAIFANVVELANPWYGSTFCFPLGILYAQYEERILNFIKRHYISTILSSSLLTVLGIVIFFFLADFSFVSNVIGRSIASIFFCILVVALLLKWTIGNRITVFLGNISYELFLVHELIINKHFHANVIINTGIVILLSITAAHIFYRINRKL